jgi:hypothetical protein
MKRRGGGWRAPSSAVRHGNTLRDMRVSVLLQITADDGAIGGGAVEVMVFDKQTNYPEDLGLSIAESKAMLAAVQDRIVGAQVASWAERHRCCKACGSRRRSKGSYSILFHTLYGDVRLASPRLRRCPCQKAQGPASVVPLRDLLSSQGSLQDECVTVRNP